MRLILPELLESGKWNRLIALYGPWLILFIVGGLIATLFSVVTTHGVGVSTGFTDGLFYCDTSDKIRYAYADNAFNKSSPYWDSDLFLSVTMGFHGLTFTQAKAIDICFDLVVGRGSQVLLLLATYPLLRRAVLRSLEIREFSLALVLPFFMERLTIYTLWAMIANMRTVRKRKPESSEQITRSRIRIDWRIVLVFLVGCYILAVPTFLSAMTSYQTRGQPFFPGSDGSSYTSAENVTFPEYFVQGGEQIGLSEEYPVYKNTDPQIYATLSAYLNARSQVSGLFDDAWDDFFRNYSAEYRSAYDHSTDGDGHTYHDDITAAQRLEAELIFNKTLKSLPLRENITDPQTPPTWSYTLWPRKVTWGRHRYTPVWQDCSNSTIVIRNMTFDVVSSSSIGLESNTDAKLNPWRYTRFSWGDSNITAYGESLAAIGICLPSKDYVWGFSSLMLFTFCMLTIATLLLLAVLHYDAYFNSMADRYKLRISPYRDVLDLADELRAHYGEAEAASMPAMELDKAMQKDPATISLETAALHKTRVARWKQGKSRRRMPTWKSLRRESGAAERSSPTDAEESLMSIGRDVHVSDFEMGKLPAKAVTKQLD